MNVSTPSGQKLHQLIVGVSDYPNLISDQDQPTPSHHFGLRPLSTAATAAYRVYEWLNANAATLSVPLGSLWLLLSPSKEEAGIAIPSGTPRATFENFDSA